MLSAESLDALNESLLLKYGRKWDKPSYQVVWSTNAREHRFVEGVEYFGNYKIRDVKKIQEMAKYPRPDDRDKYVLEILVPIPLQLKEELYGLDGNLTYEPLFIFKKSIEGEVKGVDPTWPMVNILAYFSSAATQETISPEYEIHKMEKRDYEEALDILDNELPDLAVSLRRGSSVSFGGVKAFLVN